MSKGTIEFLKDAIAIISGIAALLTYVWFMATDHQVLMNVCHVADTHEAKITNLQSHETEQDISQARLAVKVDTLVYEKSQSSN